MKIIYLLWSEVIGRLSFVYKFLIFTPLIIAVTHDAQLIGRWFDIQFKPVIGRLIIVQNF